MTINVVKSVACLVMLALFVGVAVPPQAHAMLVPTPMAQAGQEMNSAADRETIQKALESKALRGRLHALGLSDAEIESRLSRLSDQQRHQLASQIKAVNPAGDGLVIGLLVVVVLVLLIVFLVKRV